MPTYKRAAGATERMDRCGEHAPLRPPRHCHSDRTSVKRARPPEDVAQRLSVSPTAKKVVERENWYFAEDTPVQVCWTYIPVGIASGSVLARNADLGTGSIYARLEDLGYPPRIDQGGDHGPDADAA